MPARCAEGASAPGGGYCRRRRRQLKAILHNCAVHGPVHQNRAGVPDLRAHLLGRVSWVESVNPVRGAKLRRRFEQIDRDA